jgi:hypothetical protein
VDGGLDGTARPHLQQVCRGVGTRKRRAGGRGCVKEWMSGCVRGRMQPPIGIGTSCYGG